MKHTCFSGKVSLKKTKRKTKSMMDNVMAHMAGYTNQSPDLFLAQMEKKAPMMGPKRNPMEKAMPIKAMPLPLVFGVESSVTMAVARLTLPLQRPPTIRARTKMENVLAMALKEISDCRSSLPEVMLFLAYQIP